jgi:hypothetical protein
VQLPVVDNDIARPQIGCNYQHFRSSVPTLVRGRKV